MVNVFCDSVACGQGNLQMLKEAVVTVDKFKDYISEIGFPPYRLHTNVEGVFGTPIRVRVFVLDDVATIKIGNRRIAADKISSKLVYFVKGDRGSDVALHGDR